MGRIRGDLKKGTFTMTNLLPSEISLYPGQKLANGNDDLFFTIGDVVDDRETYREIYVVALPPAAAPPSSPPKTSSPSAPTINSLIVRDGHLELNWSHQNNHPHDVDLDGFVISVWENGVDLGVRTLDDPNARRYRFEPTKGNSDYRLLIQAYNDKWNLWKWSEKRYFSPWVHADVRTGAMDGWPPENAWQRYEFRPANSTKRAGICAISRIPNHIDVFWTENVLQMAQIHTAWLENNQWKFGPVGICATDSKISAVSRFDDSIDLFCRGPVGNVIHIYWRYADGWRTEALTDTKAVAKSSHFATVSRSASHVETFFITPSGEIRNVYWYEGGNWGSDVLAPAGSARTDAAICAVSRMQDTMEVFWVDPAGAVKHLYWYEGIWRSGELAPSGSALPHAISVTSHKPSNMDLFWFGTKCSVEHAYYSDGHGWKPGQLAPDFSVMPNAGISSLSRQTGHLEVWWSSPVRLLVNAYWYEGQNWNRSELPSRQNLGTYCTNISSISRAPNTMEIFATTTAGTIEDAYIYLNW